MEKYLILLDLDGTLLNDKKEIDDLNRKVITEIIKLGHEIVIVTGRAHYRSHMYYEELGLRSLLVNRNAGHIHWPNKESFEEVIEYIDKNVITTIINHPFKAQLNKMYLEDKNNIYVHKGDTDFYNLYSLCKCFNMEENFHEKINLISLIVDQDKKADAVKFLDTIKTIKHECFSFDNQTIINIYPLNVDKVNALKYLSEHFQIPNDRIIAIGDEINDVQLIKEAGIGVAMNNAIEEVKASAKLITKKTNNESGVGEFLKDFLNLNL